MMRCTCDVCGKVIFQSRFGGISHALQEAANSRDTMIIKTRSKDGTCTNYDDVCEECTKDIISYIASRKVICK